jgi:hypothetical protein
MIAAEARACTLADGTAVQAMAGTGASTLCTRVMCAAEPCVRSCMALVWQLLHLCGRGPRRGAYLRAVGGQASACCGAVETDGGTSVGLADGAAELTGTATGMRPR